MLSVGVHYQLIQVIGFHAGMLLDRRRKNQHRFDATRIVCETVIMHEAMLYEREDGNVVNCLLCAHRCRLREGASGICGVRRNVGGTLYSLVYGAPLAANVDPIEKKPLYHFHPGAKAYSVGTAGCNFKCRWCQNAEISQVDPHRPPLPARRVEPAELVARARRANCSVIAYTYTEPTVFFEYAYDTARAARDAGLANVIVSNGFMTSEMLETFHPWLDAANIDLKAFSEQVYRQYTGGRLAPVLDNLRRLRELGVWLEVTTLLIPGLNDDDDQLRAAAAFIADELGPETPWHLSRFFPLHNMTDSQITPQATLQRAVDIGRRKGLRHIYMGNVREAGTPDTCCPECGAILIRRRGYGVAMLTDADGLCPSCGKKAAGVGMFPG